MVASEPELRRRAIHAWPADAWSEDDHFHHLEHEHAEEVARDLHTSESEVLRALDDGMREHWESAALKATVPPCRPRPITD